MAGRPTPATAESYSAAQPGRRQLRVWRLGAPALAAARGDLRFGPGPRQANAGSILQLVTAIALKARVHRPALKLSKDNGACH